MKYNKKEDVELGLRLYEARERMQYTQNQFAETLGVEVSQYRRIEKGESRITVDKIRLLNDVYSIRPDFLLCGDTDDKTDLVQSFNNATIEEKQELIAYISKYLIRVLEK